MNQQTHRWFWQHRSPSWCSPKPAISSPVLCRGLLWHPVNVEPKAVLGGFTGSTIWKGALFNVTYAEKSQLWAPPFTSQGAAFLKLTPVFVRNAQSKLGLVLCYHVIQIQIIIFFFSCALNSFHLRNGTEADKQCNMSSRPNGLQWLQAAHSHLSSPSQTDFCLAWRKTMLLYQFTCFCEHVTI